MKITPAEVRDIAALARLALTEEETERLTRELGGILAHMDDLAAVDVEGVPPTTHAVALDLALRDDEPGEMLGAEAALAAAPRRDGSFFVVPRVLAHDKESGA